MVQTKHLFTFLAPKHTEFFLRPFCAQFLRELGESYEIIILTTGTKQYTKKIIDRLDPSNFLIKNRLYRDHIINLFKDFSCNIKDNYSLQPENGLQIKSWKGDDINDSKLNNIKKLLLEIKDPHQKKQPVLFCFNLPMKDKITKRSFLVLDGMHYKNNKLS